MRADGASDRALARLAVTAARRRLARPAAGRSGSAATRFITGCAAGGCTGCTGASTWSGHAAPTELGPFVAALLARRARGNAEPRGGGTAVADGRDRARGGRRDASPGAGRTRGPACACTASAPWTRAMYAGAADCRSSAPARTLVDLAGVLGADDLDAAFERARTARLRAAGGRARGARAHSRAARRHRRAARAGRRPAGADPLGGRAPTARPAAAAAGCPRPLTNVRLAGHEVDMVWRDAGLVVEVDGYAWHRGRRVVRA